MRGGNPQLALDLDVRCLWTTPTHTPREFAEAQEAPAGLKHLLGNGAELTEAKKGGGGAAVGWPFRGQRGGPPMPSWRLKLQSRSWGRAAVREGCAGCPYSASFGRADRGEGRVISKASERAVFKARRTQTAEDEVRVFVIKPDWTTKR